MLQGYFFFFFRFQIGRIRRKIELFLFSFDNLFLNRNYIYIYIKKRLSLVSIISRSSEKKKELIRNDYKIIRLHILLSDNIDRTYDSYLSRPVSLHFFTCDKKLEENLCRNLILAKLSRVIEIIRGNFPSATDHTDKQRSHVAKVISKCLVNSSNPF